jgi:thioredoxin 1
VPDVGDDAFEHEVLHAARPVVVDFWAPWCAPCRAVEAVLRELERRYAGRAEFVRVNVDENPATAARFEVLALPTVVVFAAGRAAATVVGARPSADYERALAEVIPPAERDRSSAE